MDKDKFLDVLRQIYRSQDAGTNAGVEAFGSLRPEEVDAFELMLKNQYSRDQDIPFYEALSRVTRAEKARRDPMAVSNYDGEIMDQGLIDRVLRELGRR